MSALETFYEIIKTENFYRPPRVCKHTDKERSLKFLPGSLHLCCLKLITRKKSESTRYCHSRENGNPVKSNSSGLPLPDQVEDKLRGSDGLRDFLRDHQS